MVNPNAATFFNTCFLKYFLAGPAPRLKIDFHSALVGVLISGTSKGTNKKMIYESKFCALRVDGERGIHLSKVKRNKIKHKTSGEENTHSSHMLSFEFVEAALEAGAKKGRFVQWIDEKGIRYIHAMMNNPANIVKKTAHENLIQDRVMDRRLARAFIQPLGKDEREAINRVNWALSVVRRSYPDSPSKSFRCFLSFMNDMLESVLPKDEEERQDTSNGETLRIELGNGTLYSSEYSIKSGILYVSGIVSAPEGLSEFYKNK